MKKDAAVFGGIPSEVADKLTDRGEVVIVLPESHETLSLLTELDDQIDRMTLTIRNSDIVGWTELTGEAIHPELFRRLKYLLRAIRREKRLVKG